MSARSPRSARRRVDADPGAGFGCPHAVTVPLTVTVTVKKSLWRRGLPRPGRTPRLPVEVVGDDPVPGVLCGCVVVDVAVVAIGDAALTHREPRSACTRGPLDAVVQCARRPLPVDLRTV